RELLNTLPRFCRDYFHDISDYTSTRTRLAYAYDLRVFFEFMQKNNSVCAQYEMTQIPIDVLDQITKSDINEYLDYMNLYEKDGKKITNHERGKSRKLASLRSFYNYYFTSEKIKTNPAALIKLPKLHEKEIIRLEPNETATLLDQVEDGSKLTKKQLEYHKKTRVRDVALLTLLLGTGIRVSECVGLNLNDVDLENGGLTVHRKGGYNSIVYFGDEVELALREYMEVRENIVPVTGHEEALFLSLQQKRIGVRAVENLVKKYAQNTTTLKKITPHKLRSTYGTALYNETGDIYLVANVLGHKDVNTTRKHYAAVQDETRRKAANAVKLRSDADGGKKD
ncbi:MAG: tyrosine-type recombinase/integrase, partial [Lachnospiraceae bacterium]|nr:tyrosine-type recombinase/integrase [Lachnospiraceae bacterium]